MKSSRNLIEIYKTLSKLNLPKEANVKISFILQEGDITKTDVLREGLIEDVIAFIKGGIIPPQAAMHMVYALMAQLIDRSNVQCILATYQFENNQPAGTGIINETITVDSGSINAFISAVGGHFDLFKKALRDKGIPLDSDNTIILPGGFSAVPPIK